MTKKEFIIALDQGTTSCRACLVDADGYIQKTKQIKLTQLYPQTNWVEQDANLIWNTQLSVLQSLFEDNDLSIQQILGLGITNQRETIVCWNKKTGIPVYNAIVWQDQRTLDVCESLSVYKGLIKEKTGLLLNPYFSATKIKWILENVPAAQKALAEGELLCGTIDSWLIWKLSRNQVHVTDVSNAARTMLFNIHTMSWDDELLNLFNIPKSILPEVRPSGSLFAEINPSLLATNNNTSIKIMGVLGDQQASLFGHLCHSENMIKNTYGTGCFTLVNTGNKIVDSEHLLSTVAWQIENQAVVYALEGSVFIAGSAIEWLKDALRIIYDASECDYYSNLIKNEDNPVYLIPAFKGLGAPYWDIHSKGAIFGLDLNTKREHIVWAVLQAIGFQVSDLINAIKQDLGIKEYILKVDGGISHSSNLMQFQSDILQTYISKHKQYETTSLGVAYLTGLMSGFYKDLSSLPAQQDAYQIYEPQKSLEEVEHLLNNWQTAIKRVLNWSKEIK
ncbi:glycerol kinase GlpK [Ureaplasma sp. ES3154-GEN]|uniref:glycerol kinase GlpK n=1 Tax=Ureaplasma sp. ES3154-GEN TaxID=2984844 RepID=UPI0021E72CDA|nr:glycerol kinase GlpK [Ureaplasma sp. ES3154-GEN]